MEKKTCDLLAMGRSPIDLYSNDIGAPFPEIKSFAGYLIWIEGGVRAGLIWQLDPRS